MKTCGAKNVFPCGANSSPARITQADMDRAARMVRNSGFKQARIIMDLANQRIEVILGKSAAEPASAEERSDDDV